MILNTNHGLLSPQSPPLASRKPPYLPDLETLQFPPRLYREPSPHSQECLCHQEDSAGHPLQDPGRRPRQGYNRPSLVERSNHRCPHNRNASQGRIHSPPVLPPFFCGHAQPRPYPDLAKRPWLCSHPPPQLPAANSHIDGVLRAYPQPQCKSSIMTWSTA